MKRDTRTLIKDTIMIGAALSLLALLMIIEILGAYIEVQMHHH